MDREFTWNRVEPNETPSYGKSRQAEVDEIKSKIESLKAERAQLVTQLGDEYSDERLGAQMLRAGDEGAMYKFLRGQQDQLRMNALENANKNKPTQADVDKLLETLYATEASIDPNTKGEQLKKAQQLTNLYRSQLDAMCAANPELNFRGYEVSCAPNQAANNGGAATELSTVNRGNAPEAGGSGWGQPGDLNYFKYSMLSNGANMTDDEIDQMKNQAIEANRDYAPDFEEVATAAKKKNESRYQEYKAEVSKKNAIIEKIFKKRRDVNDPATKDLLAEVIKSYGGGFDIKGNLKKLKVKSKDDYLKGK